MLWSPKVFRHSNLDIPLPSSYYDHVADFSALIRDEIQRLEAAKLELENRIEEEVEAMRCFNIVIFPVPFSHFT